MSDRDAILPESSLVLFEESEQECLTTIRYIEALKV
jgi:hypothetical protein